MFHVKRLAVANQKGGVGKTTTAISLAAALAILEKRVLLVDFDPQGNTTGGLGVDKGELEKTVYDWILGNTTWAEVARPTSLPLLTLVPASRELVGAEIELVNVEKREYLLAGKLDALEGEFDYVFVDCPPSLGLLTLNALTAVDGVIVPIQCEYYALEGVSELVSTIERVRENLNPRLEIAGVVATMWDERLNLSRQVLDEIRRYFGDAFLEPAVPRNVRLGEAPSFGKPIFLYDVRSRGAEAYLAIARELLRRDLAGEAGGKP